MQIDLKQMTETLGEVRKLVLPYREVSGAAAISKRAGTFKEKGAAAGIANSAIV